MSRIINKVEAEKTLLASNRMKCSKKGNITNNIRTVLRGSHKTYKYILVNGLLAKATDETINAIALQAGAPIDGAFDARSLCHSVLVPFERDFLNNALGGSNEPFLNKPARFTHLSVDNAVRKGKDKETLNLLIDIFSSISTSKESKEYLACALGILRKSAEENKKLHDVTMKYNPTLLEIYEFIYRFLEKSYEGETSAIIVGALEKIYHRRLAEDFKVIVHKINQSGASSKEVGDIDIYRENDFLYAIEVKDKIFSEYDLEHALKKIQENGGLKGQFIYGPHASYDHDSINKKIEIFEEEGFMILLQDIYSYSRIMIFKIGMEYKQEFIHSVMEVAIEMNSKEETKKWIQALLNDLNWKL